LTPVVWRERIESATKNESASGFAKNGNGDIKNLNVPPPLGRETAALEPCPMMKTLERRVANSRSRISLESKMSKVSQSDHFRRYCNGITHRTWQIS
jgi:hypothetical protein